MDGVMRAVFDASADVAGLAMKCASAVARSGTRATAREAAETLCARAGGRDAEGRDAACVCLKTMMVDIGTFGEEARSGTLETCVPALASHVETAARLPVNPPLRLRSSTRRRPAQTFKAGSRVESSHSKPQLARRSSLA